MNIRAFVGVVSCAGYVVGSECVQADASSIDRRGSWFGEHQLATCRNKKRLRQSLLPLLACNKMSSGEVCELFPSCDRQ